MSINVLVNGAFGKMGRITTAAIEAHPELTLVGQTGREYDLQASIKDSNAQVVVDFTHPDSVYKNITNIIEAGAHPVVGTTGLKPNEIKMLQDKCKQAKLGGIIAPNFSLGAVLMMKYASEIAKYMHHVEIIEYHHDNKADSPSGTALRTADLLAASLPEQKQTKPTIDTIPGSRGASQHGIPIHAIRLPGFLAHEEVVFGGTGETLTIRHDSSDRVCFQPGICLACEKVIKLNELIVGLEHIL